MKAGTKDLRGEMAMLRDVLLQKPTNLGHYPHGSDSIRLYLKEVCPYIWAFFFFFLHSTKYIDIQN